MHSNFPFSVILNTEVSTSRSKMAEANTIHYEHMLYTRIFPFESLQQCLPFACRVSNGNVQYVLEYIDLDQK